MKRAARAPTRPARAAGQATTRALALQIPADLQRRAENDRSSLLNVLLDAIEAAREDIAGGHLATAAPIIVRTELFERPRSNKEGDANKLMNLRLPTQALDTIDDLWPAAGAASRSQDLRGALALYLGEE